MGPWSDRMSAFIRRVLELAVSLQRGHVSTQRGSATYKPIRDLRINPTHAVTLILGFPASRIVRSKFLLFKPPGLTKTRSKYGKSQKSNRKIRLKFLRGVTK